MDATESDQAAAGSEVTALLKRWRRGDREALDELLPRVYGELRRMAAHAMRGERPDHTLRTTALVHEAYLRLAEARSPEWQDRGHFYAVAARLMRRILVDHARGLHAARRGGGARKVALAEDDAAVDDPLDRLLDLDAALTALAAADPRKARVIELRFFTGLTVTEAASVLGVSEPTVILDTRLARAWLFAWIERSRTGDL